MGGLGLIGFRVHDFGLCKGIGLAGAKIVFAKLVLSRGARKAVIPFYGSEQPL